MKVLEIEMLIYDGNLKDTILLYLYNSITLKKMLNFRKQVISSLLILVCELHGPRLSIKMYTLRPSKHLQMK